MTRDGGIIGSAVVTPRAAGNGAVPLPEGSLDLLADMTRFREENERLRQLAAVRGAEMESLSQRKDEFIAIAAHDLKSPLTAILGCAQLAVRLLARPAPDLDKVTHALDVIQERSRAMTHLLEDLLDASHCHMGALEVRPTSCEMGTSLTTVLARLGPDERERVDVTVPPAAVGHWDQRRVEQVLANLIGNALKYSPDDSRVTIVVTQHDTGIEVAVSDHGIGIPADELAQIFERFHRTTQAQASGLAGNGLGLYICHCIVAAHGGSLWAESAGENLGATFRFSLPYQQFE